MKNPHQPLLAKPVWSWVVAALILLCGLLVNGAIYRARTNAAQHAFLARLEGQSLAIRQAVLQEAGTFIDVLESIRSLHSISEQVTARDFEEFLEKGMLYQRHILGGFGLIQRLSHADRLMRETAATSVPAARLIITEYDDDGGISPANRRPEYYPVTFQTPGNALPVPVGFDMGSFPAGKSAIESMLKDGATVMAGPAGKDQNAYYVFSPIVYHTMPGMPLPFPPPGYLVGFAVSVFDPSAILKRVQESIDVHGFNSVFIPLETAKKVSAAPDNAIRFEHALTIAGEQWLMINWITTQNILLQPGWQRDSIFWLGLLITLLLAAEWLQQSSRHRRAENLVQKRTADLRRAKEQIEADMNERVRLENEIIKAGNREKLRIGRDLHDSLGQKLTGALFISKALARRKDDDEDAGRLTGLLKEAVTQVRRLAHGLAPVDLGDTGLCGALAHLAEETQRTYGIQCAFEKQLTLPEPTGQTAIHLYHIAQEAVSNAVRHGKAGNIRISLEITSAGGRLDVEDDGGGIPDETRRADAGIGIRMMQHRADIIGGSLSITPRPDGGTSVICHIPATQT